MDPARVGPRQRRGIRVVSAVALLAGVTAVAPGCGAPGSLTQVANDLQAALLSMPGVSDAWVYHEESYAEGVIFNIAVDVPAATRQQLVDIADRIDTNRIGLISNYTQNVEFWVTPNRPVTLRRQAHFDPSQVADDASSCVRSPRAATGASTGSAVRTGRPTSSPSSRAAVPVPPCSTSSGRPQARPV